MTRRGSIAASILAVATASSTAASAADAAPSGYGGIERGIVVIERDGRAAALGTVLDGDGRILTALSGLGGSDQVDVRYVDGTIARAGVVRQDSTRDLALLSPQGLPRTEGLRASEADARAVPIAGLLATPSAQLAPAQTVGSRDVRSSTGVPLHFLGVDTGVAATAGAPLLDASGHVVAVMVHACDAASPPGASQTGWWSAAPTPACRPVLAGVPVAELRAFLAPAAPAAGQSSQAIVAAPAAHPWLGIQGDAKAVDGVQSVRVLAVAAGSPAALAGLVAQDDVIVAVDGRRVEKPADLAAEIAKRSVGDRVQLLVRGRGGFRDVLVALHEAPRR
ncbi:MAG TPA: PDZ domain-containing protein [Polyangiaceae bacterium]